MRVRYIYSACVVIESPEVRILCDPWFTPGAFDGSWFQYPPLPSDPVSIIGPVDYIYISHIHPDHYDPFFLRRYLATFPQARLLVGITEPPYLLQKMKADGFSPEVAVKWEFGATRVYSDTNGAQEFLAIDTALIVTRCDQSVVNLNDNHFDQQQVNRILRLCPKGRPTLALLPYAGAGPYPQTYFFEDKLQLIVEAKEKKELFLQRYKQYVDALNPVRAMPFAGKYWLGGPLAALNHLRGIADATEVHTVSPDVSFVLEDGGTAAINLDTLEITDERTSPYDESAVETYLSAIPFKGYDYEVEVTPRPGHGLPIFPLLNTAFAAALKKARTPEPFYLCLRPTGSSTFFVLDTSGQTETIQRLADASELTPRLEVSVDPRHLFGLLSRFYHWNNAEIGSHLPMKRVPNDFRRDAYNFLTFLHV